MKTQTTITLQIEGEVWLEDLEPNDPRFIDEVKKQIKFLLDTRTQMICTKYGVKQENIDDGNPIHGSVSKIPGEKNITIDLAL